MATIRTWTHDISKSPCPRPAETITETTTSTIHAPSSPSGKRRGSAPVCSRRCAIRRRRNISSWKCFPIRRGACTWGTCATTRSATSWRAFIACAARRSSIRWAGTRSGCRRRTRPSRPRSIRARGRCRTSDTCASSSCCSGFRTTGIARSRPASPNISCTSSASSSRCASAGSPIARRRSSTGVPSTRRCWRTSRSRMGCAGAAGSVVQQRELEQWFLKVTAYADELLADAHRLLEGKWADKVLRMQENWIGRSRRRAHQVPARRRIGGHRGLHDAARYVVRRDASCRSRPSIRW